MSQILALVVTVIWAAISTRLALQIVLSVAGVIFGTIGLVAGRVDKFTEILGIVVGAVTAPLWLALLYGGIWLLDRWLNLGSTGGAPAVYWLVATAWVFGTIPQLHLKLRKIWRNATIAHTLQLDALKRESGLLDPEPRRVLAPRGDGTVGDYRVYADVGTPLFVDTVRAYRAGPLLAPYGRGYGWACQLFLLLPTITVFGGFASLFWWPWWSPIAGCLLAYVAFRGSKDCCADFIRDVVRANLDARDRFIAAGVVRPNPSLDAIRPPAADGVRPMGASAPAGIVRTHPPILDASIPVISRARRSPDDAVRASVHSTDEIEARYNIQVLPKLSGEERASSRLSGTRYTLLCAVSTGNLGNAVSTLRAVADDPARTAAMQARLVLDETVVTYFGGRGQEIPLDPVSALRRAVWSTGLMPSKMPEWSRPAEQPAALTVWRRQYTLHVRCFPVDLELLLDRLHHAGIVGDHTTPVAKFDPDSPDFRAILLTREAPAGSDLSFFDETESRRIAYRAPDWPTEDGEFTVDEDVSAAIERATICAGLYVEDLACRRWPPGVTAP